MAGRSFPTVTPMRCDRWIARSALQKAIRRGDNQIAQSALANLLLQDRTATWRHLVVIALEDVGVANVDILAKIVAARVNKRWRSEAGGDWPVMSALVQQMAESDHCQAACDLLMAATNLPSLAEERDRALAADIDELEARISDGTQTSERRL